MNILVTGSHGFIGHYLVKELEQAGHTVVPFDIVIGKDFTDRALVEQLFLDFSFDAVCHLGAQAYVGPAEKDPYENARVNIMGTLNLLEMAYIHHTKIIFHSTGAVYSDECPQPVSEDSPLEPKSHYGASKLAAEEYARMYARRGLPCLVTRFSSAYGIGREKAPVNVFTKKALAGEEITIYGPEVTRDYTHVSDVVRGVRILVENEKVKWNGQAFNIASGKQTRTIEVVLKLEDLLGPLNKTVMPAKKGDVLQNYFDIRKMKELGFEPQVTLDKGIKELIEHYSG